MNDQDMTRLEPIQPRPEGLPSDAPLRLQDGEEHARKDGDEPIDPETARLSPLLTFLLGALLAGGAVLAGMTLWSPQPEAFTASPPGAPELANAHEVWTCPMHPFVVSDRPGACPICHMDLVARTDSSGVDPAELARLGRVSISPVERVLANVATVPVGRTDLNRDIGAFGRLVYDETSYATIPAWVGGRIETLYIEETGTRVERGQRLLSIYSPDLLSAQEEYLVILRSGGLSEGLVPSAERRLQLLGMSRRQIRQLAERGETSDIVTVYAPASGTLVQRLVQQGDYVQEGQALYHLAGSENFWVEAEVFEKDAAFVQEGSQAEVELAAFPEESFSGILTLVWPFLDNDTRTLRVRVEFESVDPRFRSGMYATVHLSAPVAHQVLVVPADAVIRTGQRNAVYVEVEDNLFERREVELGYRAGDLFEIRSGLLEDDEVVARGGFLIDSEAQLYAGGQSLHFGHLPQQQGTHQDHLPGPVEQEGTDPITLVQPGQWYCPMGAEWVSDEPGRCPICGMNLVQMPPPPTREAPDSSRSAPPGAPPQETTIGHDHSH